MRRNSCTVIVLAGPVPAEVLGAVGRSMNVTLIRPADQDESARADARADARPDGLAAAAGALRRAARATSPYALVAADPLAAVAEGWQGMWDLTRPQGPARFEQEASAALAAWRAGQFELPDYYLVTTAEANDPIQTSTVPPAQAEQNFYLGPLRATRPHRVAFVPATEPAEQAAGVLQALGSLRHGPWWPALDELIAAARTFYPGSLAEAAPAPTSTTRPSAPATASTASTWSQPPSP
jgi:hypothetical protein